VLSEEEELVAREFLLQVRQEWRKETQAARARIAPDVLTDIEPVALGSTGSLPGDLCAGDDLIEPLQDAPDLPDPLEAVDLPSGTRRALDLWTSYRLVCFELLGSGRTGRA
jgi:hypothetical protein